MSHSKKYTEDWKKIEDAGSGGQGSTYKAHRSDDENFVAAIKVLKEQKDMERRGRMRREVASLETLSHSNIPKLIDSNTEYWENLDYKLFMATEFVNGQTLENFDFTAIDLEDKIALFRNICEVVDYCHNMGIIHRDIKPENIMLRNDSICDPVIIDFGLSFNLAEEDSDLTPDWQHIGNRFLFLPEQKVGEFAKRDYRSDVTSLVGIFFYILTNNQAPVHLINQNSQKPHQREESKKIIDSFPNHKKVLINMIFDIGFESSIDKRWQTTKSLLVQLDKLQVAEPVDLGSIDSFISEISKQVAIADYSHEKTVASLFDQIEEVVRNAASDVIEKLGKENWVYSKKITLGTSPQSQSVKVVHEESRSGTHLILNRFNKSISAELNFISFITGSEVVTQLNGGVNSIEILRQPIESSIDWIQFEQMLKQYWLEIIYSKLQ